MIRGYLSVSNKFDNVTEARDSGNLYATDQKQDLQSNQTREWRKKDGTGEYLIPDRMQTLEFLDITGKKFPSSTIKNYFKKYGFNYDF